MTWRWALGSIRARESKSGSWDVLLSFVPIRQEATWGDHPVPERLVTAVKAWKKR